LEAYSFEKSTYLNNNILIKPLTVTELKSYATLNQEIEDFKKQYNKGELSRKSKIYSSYTWYAQIFLPAVNLIEKEDILSKFPHRTYTDLYVWIQRHKYFLSQQAGHDVGFDYTAQDFAEKFKNKKLFNIIPPIFKDLLKHLVK